MRNRAVLGLVLSLAQCAGVCNTPRGRVGSGAVETKDMSPALQVVLDEHELAISAGLLGTSNTVVLEGGDELTANAGDSKIPLAMIDGGGDNVTYEGKATTLPAPGSTVVFSLARTAPKASAPESKVTLPKDFSIVSVEQRATVGGTKTFLVHTSGLDRVAHVLLGGPCDPSSYDYQQRPGDADGEQTIQVDLRMSDIEQSCTLHISVTSSQKGELDPAFATRGMIEATLRRSVDVQLVK